MNSNLNLLIDYLEKIKQVELTEADIKTLDDILRLERNNGYHDAVKVIEGGQKE